MLRPLAAALAGMLLAGCAAPHAASGRLKIVTSTSLLAALAAPVAGDRADVSALVPVGASPETFEPRSEDLRAVADADVLVVNGAGLEAWLAGLLRSAQRPATRVVVLADGLSVQGGNPHLWLDPRNARAYVRRMAAAFTAADPANAAAYRAAATAFDAQLAALDTRIARKIAAIPPARRDMIVVHDAWRYYDARYGIRLLGVIEERAGVDPGPAHLAALADLARAHHVHTIFAEPQENPKLARVLAETAGVRDVAVLDDDSVGTNDANRTFIAMLDHDTDVIVAGLK